jgi:hypothetical protein
VNAPANDDRVIVAALPKSRAGTTVVALVNGDGLDRIDIRTFAHFRNAAQHMPTRKGISIRVEQIPKLVAALQAAATEARLRALYQGRESG